MEARKIIENKKLLIFDIEGVLIQDIERPKTYTDAEGLIGHLKEQGYKVATLTNVGRKSRNHIYKVLKSTGHEFELKEIYSASYCTALYVKQHYPNSRNYIISEGGVIEDFLSLELDISWENGVDNVIFGADRNIDYYRLNYATRKVLEGARLIGVSGTTGYTGKYLSDEGFYLGEGALILAIEAATGKKATIIGKPREEIFKVILQDLSIDPSEVLMIGDNPYSDVLGGNSVGLQTLLIDRENKFQVNALPESARPTTKIKSFKEII